MSDKSREDYGGWVGAAVATYFGGPQYAAAGKEAGEYLAGTTNGSDGKDTSIKDIGVAAGEGYVSGETGYGGSTGSSYDDYINYGSKLLEAYEAMGGSTDDITGAASSGNSLGGVVGGGDSSSGDDTSNPDGSGDSYMQYADLIGQAANFGYGLLGDKKKNKQAKEDRKAKEQNSLRGEATYRQNRALLMDQIGQFYAKRGWKLPETNFPGQGTSRPLPGDQNPYAGYDVPQSYENHQPLDENGKPIKFDPNDPNSTVNQASAKPTEGQLVLKQASGPNIEQAKIAAAQFKPVNQPKALRANLMAQAAGGSTEPIQVQDPMTETAPSAPQFVNYNQQPKTAMPSTTALGNTGRRLYGY